MIPGIKKTSGNEKPPIIAIHGANGVGKTTLGASANSPIFVPTEDGLTGIAGIDTFAVSKSYPEFKANIEALIKEEHDYKTIVVDSLDWLETLIHAQTALAHKKESIEAFGYGKGYVEALVYWREFINMVKFLRDKKRMAVLMIAHTHIRRHEPPEGDSYDRYEIKLHRMASALVQEACDIVGFACHDNIIVKKNEGFNQTRAVAKATGKRSLQVGYSPAYESKNRYGMPETIDLSWSDLIKNITN